MQSIVLVIHVVLAMTIIGLVLIQHGKGADAGAAFGSGASATVFGAKGSASFLTRLTTMAAIAFFLTSLALFYMAAHRENSTGSVVESLESIPEETAVEAPAAPPAPAAGQSDLPAAPAMPQGGSDEIPAAPVTTQPSE